MALGNRPKGSKWGYTTAFITFAISESLPSPRSTSKIGTDLFDLITLSHRLHDIRCLLDRVPVDQDDDCLGRVYCFCSAQQPSVVQTHSRLYVSETNPPTFLSPSIVAFTQIVLSIVATFGIYILASLIHYDPYHMVTSLVQVGLTSSLSQGGTETDSPLVAWTSPSTSSSRRPTSRS